MSDPRSTYDIEVHDLPSPVPSDPSPVAPEPPEVTPSWATGTAWGGEESVGNWETMPPPATPLVPTPIELDARPRRQWSRLLPRTLFSRLVAGVVVLVIVVVTTSGWCTSVLLHRFLYQRLDQQVAVAATGNTSSFVSGISGSGRGQLRMTSQVYIAVFEDTGSQLSVSNPFLNSFSVSTTVRQQLIARQSLAPTTISSSGSDATQLRVAVRHGTTGIPDANGNLVATNVTAVIGLPTTEVNKTLHQLLIVELAIGAGAVVVAFLLSAYGVRLSLKQLTRVTTTAREVTTELATEGGGLDRRVQVTEPDTEVGQLAESVNTLLETVEAEFAARVESEDRMRQFLADASHELRTPLTSIRGYAELSRMRRQSGGDGSEDADTLDRIESEGTRMSRLVDDLLTLARSDQGSEPVFEIVDIDELADDAVRGARAAFPQRRIDIATAPGLTVEGDHDQLLRVLRNLINNAAAHTRPDGAIRVRADAEGDEVVLRVDDEGPGLTPDEAAHVFERFWRADKARTRAKGGSGLGLSIVSSIVESHGGTAQFESSPQTGSTVTIRLPATIVQA
jgi:two-component system, OmpR family, sensor kinase